MVSQTFTLTTTDSGGSGVADTCSIASTPGAWTSGTSVPVPAPASGTVMPLRSPGSRRDNAGNQTSGSTSVYIRALADTVAPSGSVVIDAGAAWTNRTAVTLSPSATDNVAVAQMQFSNDNVSWSAWETYSAGARSWTLVAGNGNKTVYARYRDAAGNVSALSSDAIGLDAIAPVTASDVVGGHTYSGTKTFTLAPSDASGSGLAGTWWQLDSTSGVWTVGTSVVVEAPSSGTAVHTLYWYSKDLATNTEITKSVAFAVSAPIPDAIAPTGFLDIDGGSGLDEQHGGHAPAVSHRQYRPRPDAVQQRQRELERVGGVLGERKELDADDG